MTEDITLKLCKYLGNEQWGKPFDYVLKADDVKRVNNTGLGYYTIHKFGRGRPKQIFHQIHPILRYNNSTIENPIDCWNWKKGQTFFYQEEHSRLFAWASKQGKMTTIQPMSE